MNPIHIAIATSIITIVVFYIGATVGRSELKKDIMDLIDDDAYIYVRNIDKLKTADSGQIEFAKNLIRHFKNNLLDKMKGSSDD